MQWRTHWEKLRENVGGKLYFSPKNQIFSLKMGKLFAPLEKKMGKIGEKYKKIPKCFPSAAISPAVC